MNDNKLVLSLIKISKKAKTEQEKFELEDLVSKHRRCGSIDSIETERIFKEVSNA